MSAPTIVFATRNPGKVAELRALVEGLGVEVLSLTEIEQVIPETVEDGDTFEANAIKKAREVAMATGLPALADDSGLEVDALGGAPGVHSARYAGEPSDDEANNRKLLVALAGVEPARRTARFRSVLALVDGADPQAPPLVAHGACEGVVLEAPRGSGGFGYDPLFYAPELGATFAELGVGPKNQLSHRARAMKALQPLLIQYFHLAKAGPAV